MNILLLNPPPNDRSWYRVEHLGMAYLAAVLRREGHTVHILDSLLESLNTKQAYEIIRTKYHYIDLLGITATEPESIISGTQIVRWLKEDDFKAHIVTGGYLPTFWSDMVLQMYPEVDTIVVGEGEETLTELVKTLEQNGDLGKIRGLVYRDAANVIIHNPPRPLIRDLDDLPFPARDSLSLANQKYYHASMSGSRGCYHQCSFCQIAQFYRLSSGVPYRTRSAKNIADEIELLVNKHRIRSIYFVDDEFITESANRHQVIWELIDEIKTRKIDVSLSIQFRADTGKDENLLSALKEVGVKTVFIGVESGVDSVLQRFNKGILRKDVDRALQIVQGLDFNLIIGYLVYNPDTDFEELRQSVKYLTSPDVPLVKVFHGMNILKDTEEDRKIIGSEWARRRGFNIGYRVKDERVATFANWLRAYYEFYRPVVLDIYELIFLFIDIPDDILAEMRLVEDELRTYHNLFLNRAIDSLTLNPGITNFQFDEFQTKLQDLYIKSHQLVNKVRLSYDQID